MGASWQHHGAQAGRADRPAGGAAHRAGRLLRLRQVSTGGGAV